MEPSFSNNDSIDDASSDNVNSKYLEDNPMVELSLWSEWVCVVCGWDKIPSPSVEEWEYLKSNFYSGKAPITSVAELVKFRDSQKLK